MQIFSKAYIIKNLTISPKLCGLNALAKRGVIFNDMRYTNISMSEKQDRLIHGKYRKTTITKMTVLC